MRHFLVIGLVLLFSDLLHGQSMIKRTYFDEEKQKLKEVISLNPKDSTLEGRYQSFFITGSLASAGYYHHDNPDSSWVFHFENGHEKASGKYRNGKQIGLWKYYFENGNPKAIGSLKGTIKHGNWTFFYESGKEKSSGQYFNDLKEGLWDYYFEDGIIKAQSYYSKGTGIYKEFYPSGKLRMEGTNVNEKSEGFWTYYFESGEKEADGNYLNGLRSGPWKYYYPNDQIAAEGSYQNGEKEGIWKYYFPDGSLKSEGEMIDDQKDGFWKLYYQSGEVKGEGRYEVGSGDYLEFYENGKQKARGQYLNSKKEGDWVYYSEEGLEDGFAHFENGEGDYTGRYQDGTLKMTGRLKDDRRIGEWTLYNPDGTIAGVYRPVYEDEKPIFRTAESLRDPADKMLFDKPEYRYKNNKIRYFQPRINEFTGFIIGTNPLWSLIGKWPIAIEYYLQERLGYEAQLTINKSPFFTNPGIQNLGTRGVQLEVRQKFYSMDSKTGMVYFGQQVLAGYLQHSAMVLDSSIFIGLPPDRVNLVANEGQLGYGLFIGNRWMQRTGDSGVTIDFHVGLSIARRFYQAKFEPIDDEQGLFRKLDKESIYFPIIFGINIGYAGPKRRSISF